MPSISTLFTNGPLEIAILAAAIYGVVVLIQRLTRSEGHQRGTGPMRRCPVCGTYLRQVGEACGACGWSASAVGVNGPRRIAIRQLRQLQQRELIDEQTLETLVGHLRSQPAAAGKEQPRELASDIVAAELVTDVTPSASAPPAPPRPEPELSDPPSPAQAPPPPRPMPVPVAQRAAQFVANQEQAAARAAAVAASPPRPPQKAWGEMLTAFLEQRHIRWGELVGGLLIVSCSIALVISFWGQIAEKPWLKFGVFNGVTAALFGAGLHAARRWKLPTTSQGLLIIATLLVPLNFLAIAAITTGSDSSTAFAAGGEIFALGGEIMSLALFAGLVWLAGRVILPSAPLALTAIVMGQCILQLLIRRWVGPETPQSGWTTLYLMGTLCLLAYCAANLWSARDWIRGESLSDQRANEVFKLLGLSSFATLLPAGMLILKTEDLSVVRQLAPLAVLAAIPAFAAGLPLWPRPDQKKLSGLQVAGSSLAVCGAMLLAAGLILAWPQPYTLIPTAALSFVALTVIAIWFAIAEVHLAAAFCLGMTYLLTFHVLSGRVGWQVTGGREIVHAFLDAVTGNALIGLVALFGVAAGGFAARNRVRDARYLAAAASVAAIASLGLVTAYGLGRVGDPNNATWVYGIYAAMALAAAIATRQSLAAWACAGLLFLAIAQAVVFRYAEAWTWWHWTVAFLVHATVTIGLAGLGRFVWPRLRPLAMGRDTYPLWADPWCAAGFLDTLLLVPLLMGQALVLDSTTSAIQLSWLGGVWLALSILHASPALFTAFQMALTLALVVAVDQRLSQRDGYAAVMPAWLHPARLQVQGVTLAAWGTVWSATRLGLRRWGIDRSGQTELAWQWIGGKLLYPAWPSFDSVMAVGLVILLAILSVCGVVPGVAQELSPQLSAGTETVARYVPAASQWELLGWPHGVALGRGSWAFVIALTVLLVIRLREKLDLWCLAGIAVVVSAACLLLAGRWDSEVAVASALRWYTALLFGMGSLLIWIRRPLLQWLRVAGWPQATTPHRKLAHGMLVLLLFLAVAPLVAMAAFVGIAAIGLSPPSSPQLLVLQWLCGAFVICGISAIASRNVQLATRGAADRLRQSSNVLLVLGIAPLVAMTLFVVAVALRQHPIVGPEPGSFFVRIGLAASYALPMLVIALALLGHAVDQRSAPLALAAGLLLNFCATAAYLLSTRAAGLLGFEQWIRLGQWNACVASLYAMGWIWFVQRDRFARQGVASVGLLLTQVGIALGFAALAIFPAIGGLFLHPRSTFDFEICAGLWGWATLGLAIAATVYFTHGGRQPIWSWAVPSGMVAAASLAAFETHRWDFGDWETYHAMLLAYLLAGFGVLVFGWVARRRMDCQKLDGAPAPAPDLKLPAHAVSAVAGPSDAPQRIVTPWVVGILFVVILFALRSVAQDPRFPWWTVGGCAGASALSAHLAAWSSRRRFLYLAGLLLNLAVSIWWIDEGYKLLASTRGPGQFLNFWLVNVVALGIPVYVWFVIQRRFISRRPQRLPRLRLGFHRFAASLALVLLMIVAALALVTDAASNPAGASWLMGWLAWLTTAAAVGLCLWDADAQWAIGGLYLVGLTAVALFIDQWDLPSQQMLWTGTMGLAAYGVGISYLGSRRRGLAVIAAALRIPPREGSRGGLGWLIPANLMLTLTVVLLGFWSQWILEDGRMRLSASQAIIAQAFTLGMLARGRRETQLRFASLWLGVLGAIAFGWSFLEPGSKGLFLNRAVVVAAALAGMAVLYGLGLSKLLRRENDWTRAAARMTPGLCGATLFALAVVLTAEVWLYLNQQLVEMSWQAIAAVAVALAGLAVACLVAAVVPGRDPLGLNPRQRQAYVYGAEALLALLLLHVRLSMPWLFQGVFVRYWPIVVMAIAFLGVGLSEWFQRRDQEVLAQPLERTGVLLPLLPVLGYWVAPGVEVDFSLLMLVVGVLYGSLSVMRRSFGFGVLAALAVNGGLWYLLQQQEGLGLLDHPQLWLIPPALCVLIAAYLNRERLDAGQMTIVRYSTSAIIYSASTADIFLNGVAQSPWLPIVLAGLSILGILAGMALRVRAFLFLGTSFLLIALMTMIWYAAVDLHQTWLWFVTGIVAGIVIIAVFALLEKKREDVLQVVERLKEWDA